MTRWAGCGLVVFLAGAVIAQPPKPPDGPQPGPPPGPNVRPIRPVFALPGPPKLDRHGDPLPAGAVARYGTTRLRHGTDVSGIGFTPDGKLLCTVSASEDSIRMWNPETGKEVARLNVMPQLVTLAKDGAVFVVDDSKVRVWLPHTDTVRALPDKTIPEGVTPTAIAANPDGRSFALAADNKILLLDAQTGKTTRELQLPSVQNNNGGRGGLGPNGQPAPQPGPPPNRLLYSADGRWLVGSGQKTGVWLWDLRTGKRVRTYRSEYDFPEYAFSPDITKLVVTGQRLHLYALDSEEPVDGFKGPEGVPQSAPRFSADGKTLYVMSNDGTVLSLDAATGEEGDPLNPPDPNLHQPVALAPGGSMAAAIDPTGGIRIWNPETGKGPEVTRLPMLSHPAFAGGKQVTVLDQESKIHTFDALTGAPGKVTELPGDDVGLPATWDAASRRAAVIVSSGDDLEVQVIDADTGKAVSKHAIAGAAGIPFVAFAVANRDRMAMFGPNTIAVVNPTTGKLVRTIDTGRPEDNNGGFGAITPDGRIVAAATAPPTLWEVATGKKRLTLEGLLRVVAFSPDSRFAAGPDDANNAAVVDARTGAVVRRFTLPEAAGGPDVMAFNSDGKKLAVGTNDGRVTVLDVAGGEVLAPFAGHDGAVTGLAFSDDGKRLVSTASDGTALVWDVPDRPLTPGPAEKAVDGFAEAFRLMGSADARQAQRGLDYIYRHPTEAAKHAGERVPVPASVPAATIAKHIEDLAAEEFATREAAKKSLAALAGEAGPALKQAAEKSTSSEVRKVATELLNKIDAPAARPEDLRILRAVEAMENLRTADARAQLEKWAAGPPGHRLTVEATAALARLKATGGK